MTPARVGVVRSLRNVTENSLCFFLQLRQRHIEFIACIAFNWRIKTPSFQHSTFQMERK